MTQTVVEQTTIEAVETEEVTEASNNEPRHIINPPMNLHIWREGMSTQEIVDIARVRGLEVVALCGYRWIPTRDASLVKETCNACIDEAGRLMNDG